MYIYHFYHHINHHTYASFNLNHQSMYIYICVYKNIGAPNQVSTKWVLKPEAIRSQEIITEIRSFLSLEWGDVMQPTRFLAPRPIQPRDKRSFPFEHRMEPRFGDFEAIQAFPKTNRELGQNRNQVASQVYPARFCDLWIFMGDPSVKSPHRRWFLSYAGIPQGDCYSEGDAIKFYTSSTGFQVLDGTWYRVYRVLSGNQVTEELRKKQWREGLIGVRVGLLP